MDAYTLWKTAHILSAAVLFGTGLGIAVYCLYLLTGACWVPVVFIQIRLSREAERAVSIAALPDAFHQWFRRWFVLGVPAFLAVMAIFLLMVAKPYVMVSV